MSLRDIEELLFERGVTVTYGTIRCWCDKFGKGFAHRVKAARTKPGSTWPLDEMFVTLRGEPYPLWRAVDEHGAELDKSGATQPRPNVSSSVCCAPVPCHASARRNNRAKNSHQSTRERERRMRGFHDPKRTQAFLSCFGPMRQHFVLKRHLLPQNAAKAGLAGRLAACLHERSANVRAVFLPLRNGDNSYRRHCV